MNPTRRFRNIMGSFNKYVSSVAPDVPFNFQQSEFDTGNLGRWVQVEYLSRSLNVKSSIIVQLTFFAKSDRYGTKVSELCDQVLDKLYEDDGSNNLRIIDVKDWFTEAPDAPVIGSMLVLPRQANKPVVDQYNVTYISVTLELRHPRL